MRQNRDKLVVMKNYASWCGPCRQYGPVFEDLAKRNPSCVFVNANVDHNVVPVRALPTTMFLHNGNVMRQLTVEGLDAQQVQSSIDQFMSRDPLHTLLSTSPGA